MRRPPTWALVLTLWLGAGNGCKAESSGEARELVADAASLDVSGSDSAVGGSPDVAGLDSGSADMTTDALATDVAPAADAGPADGGTPDASSGDASSSDSDNIATSLPPTDVTLLAWLTAGGYLSWPAESAVHASSGPHFGKVRSFFTPELAASLAAGNQVHPLGSAAVKELYGNGIEVAGWSVARKTAGPNDGASWYWYEVYNGKVYAASQGATLCTGCHSGGTDFVLSGPP